MKTVRMTVTPPRNLGLTIGEPKCWWAIEGELVNTERFGVRPKYDFMQGAPDPLSRPDATVVVADDAVVVAGFSWDLKKKEGGQYTARLKATVGPHQQYDKQEFGLIGMVLERA